MSSIEEIVRLSIKDGAIVQPPPALAGRVLLVIERKKRLYAVIKLTVYSALTLASSVGCVIIWREERLNILNSEAANLLSLLFSDYTVITKYWQEYIFSLLESLPIVSIVAVAAFAWAACASLWMTTRTFTIFIHRAVRRV